MTAYLLTAAGVIFLSVVVSLLIPEGKLNKSITFVMRMICIFVLIQPVTGILKVQTSSADAPLYDYELICNVYSKNQSAQLDELLYGEFSVECESVVSIGYDSGEFSVTGVSVELNKQDEKLIDVILAYLSDLGYINITVYAKSD